MSRTSADLLEAVINVSEGRDRAVIDEVARAAGPLLLDVHSDTHHNRSVYTLAGGAGEVLEASLALSLVAVGCVDIAVHEGVHPRLGAVDVVPFVPYRAPMTTAVALRDSFARGLSETGVPCFLYGPERPLPEVRRRAFVSLDPDFGPHQPHPRAGSACVGARGLLVAYNLVVAGTIAQAREVARSLRSPLVRALAFEVGDRVQVSMNLVQPDVLGPEQAYDLVAALMPVEAGELVGLLPESVLHATSQHRLAELGLSPGKAVEARLEERGLAR